MQGNFDVNSGEAHYEAVLAGLGIGRLTAALVSQDVKSSRLHLLQEYEDNHDVSSYAVFPMNGYLLRKVKVFVVLINSFSE